MSRSDAAERVTEILLKDRAEGSPLDRLGLLLTLVALALTILNVSLEGRVDPKEVIDFLRREIQQVGEMDKAGNSVALAPLQTTLGLLQSGKLPVEGALRTWIWARFCDYRPPSTVAHLVFQRGLAGSMESHLSKRVGPACGLAFAILFEGADQCGSFHHAMDQ